MCKVFRETAETVFGRFPQKVCLQNFKLHSHGCLKFPVRFCNKVPLILSGEHTTEHRLSQSHSVSGSRLGPVGWPSGVHTKAPLVFRFSDHSLLSRACWHFLYFSALEAKV